MVLFFLGMAGNPLYAQIQQDVNDNNLHLDDSYRIPYSGAYRDFIIPAGAEGKYLFLKAQGGDGGTISYKSLNLAPGKGGQGATVSGGFKIGTGSNEIPVGATLRVIVAQAGASYENNGQSNHHCGGGGGGTGVLFLPPDISPQNADREDWIMLMVAGGGGGGFAAWGRKGTAGLPGDSREVGTSDNEWYSFSGDGDFKMCFIKTKDYPGLAGGSGGGTSYMLWSELCNKSSNNKRTGGDGAGDDDGFGGFQRQSDGRISPTGHHGGNDGPQDNNGGFGFGSGGAGYDKEPGGGGGYTGGNAGNFAGLSSKGITREPAGGGGSYVNTNYAIPGTFLKIKNGTTSNSKDGHVQYQFTNSPTVASMTKGRQFTNANSKNLLAFNDYTLRWQKDGNLVLYKGAFSAANAKWATGTEGQGKELVFQNDGNLVILDAGNQAIWATATADAQQNGKGGVSLTLTPFGALSILNTDGENIWSFY